MKNSKKSRGAQNQHLLKMASSNELRQYFLKVFELKKAGIEFPVDLDHVWPLAYTQKRDAIRVLQREFIEGEEFQACQKGKVLSFSDLKNGVKTDISITVDVMEYLVARKKKEVFEVYRKVFHSKMNPVLELRGSLEALQELKENGYIDARDIPYAKMQLNQKEVTTLLIGGVQLYCLKDYQNAIGLNSDNGWTAKQMNLTSQNAVKVHIYSKSPMWFINDFACKMLQSKAGVFKSNQLKLAL